MSELNIYQRINAVMQAVEYVQKDATVETGGGRSYKAVSHDMVLAVLRQSMVANGIVTRVEQLSDALIQMRGPDPKEKDQYSQYFYSANYAIYFVNIDQPLDFVRLTINAHAQDSGDKAPGKAVSYAVKYAMLKTFGLETGENDESRNAEFQPFTDIQRDEFHGFIEANNDPMGFLIFTKTIGDDVYGALQRTFEPGKIVAGKNVAGGLIKQAIAMVDEAAVLVEEYVNQNDTDGLIQIISEFAHPVQRKMLGAKLKPEHIHALKQIKELAA